jgi:hypothetical protein
MILVLKLPRDNIDALIVILETWLKFLVFHLIWVGELGMRSRLIGQLILTKLFNS